MTTLFLLVGFLFLALIGLLVFKKTVQTPPKNTETKSSQKIIDSSPKDIFEGVNISKKPLLTPTEKTFYTLLYQATTGHFIYPQVATSAIVKSAQSNNKYYRNCTALWNKYSRTVIDFIVCDNNLNIIAIIELDDPSHDDKKDKDQTRDKIINQAGYKTVRFDCRQMLTIEQIQKKIFS